MAALDEGLPLTENTQQFVALVRTTANAEGRATWPRGDWLRALLSADYTHLSTYLIRQVVADLPALAAAVRPADDQTGVWLSEPVPAFLPGEVEPLAREIGHDYIGTEHVLLVFTRAPGLLGDQLREAGLRWDRVRAAFDAIKWH